MATQLLDGRAATWDPKAYHDTYTEELRDRIVAKQRGHAGALPPFFSITSGMLADSGRKIEGYGGGTLGPSRETVKTARDCSA